MKKALALLLLLSVLALGLTGCVTADLVTDGRGSADVVGTLMVMAGDESDELLDGFLYIGFEMTGDWEIAKTHLYIGDAPPSKSAPGLFPYKHEGDEIKDPLTDLYKIPYEELDANEDGCVFIAAHVELRMDTAEVDELGNPIYAYETAWAQMGDGEDISIGRGRNWATGFWLCEPEDQE